MSGLHGDTRRKVMGLQMSLGFILWTMNICTKFYVNMSKAVDRLTDIASSYCHAMSSAENIMNSAETLKTRPFVS